MQSSRRPQWISRSYQLDAQRAPLWCRSKIDFASTSELRRGCVRVAATWLSETGRYLEFIPRPGQSILRLPLLEARFGPGDLSVSEKATVPLPTMISARCRACNMCVQALQGATAKGSVALIRTISLDECHILTLSARLAYSSIGLEDPPKEVEVNEAGRICGERRSVY